MVSVEKPGSPVAQAPPGVLRSERICMWCGPVLFLFFAVGFPLAGFLPPPSPGSSAVEIATFYATDIDLKRTGIVLLAVGGALMLPFGIAVASQIRRIEGRGSPMAYLQTGACAMTATATLIYMFMLLAMTFRPEGSPEIMLALNDIVWIAFIGMWQPGWLQACAVAIAVLNDHRPIEDRLWPRWVGWFTLWYTLTCLIGVLVPFFTGGPFAWHGLYAFYGGATAFLGWLAVLAVLMLRGTRTAPANAVQ